MITLNKETSVQCVTKHCGHTGYKAFDCILNKGSQYKVRCLKCATWWLRFLLFTRLNQVCLPGWEWSHACKSTFI